MALSLQESRAGVSLPLTNLAQGFVQAQMVMRLLFPLAEVGTYGGVTIQFDDSIYNDVDDARADDTPYPEIAWGYTGKPYKLNTKGLSWRLGDKEKREYNNLNMNWGAIASGQLMGRAVLRHEIEAAAVATNLSSYATTNRVTLTAGGQFNDSATDPDPIIRTAKTAVSNQVGVEPNVAVMGRDVFDALASKYSREFAPNVTIKPQLTLDLLAQIFGLQRVAICDAIVKRGGVKQKVFGKHMVLGYTNPAALNSDRLPYRPDGAINTMTPAYGYTYVMQGNPLMYQPYYDNDRGATVYKLDFDRSIVTTGVDQSSGLITNGYIIYNAVA